MTIYYLSFFLCELFLDRMEVPKPVYDAVKNGTYNSAMIDGMSFDIKSVEPIEGTKTNVNLCVCQVQESENPVL